MINVQQFSHRLGHEPVGGGDDHQRVAIGPVAVEQLLGLGEHHRLDFFRHKLFAPGQQLFRVMPCKRLKGKAQVAHDVQLAIQVLLIEAVVCLPVFLRIHNRLFHQEFPPGVVTVSGEQGVIEIKNRERQLGYLRQKRRLSQAQQSSMTRRRRLRLPKPWDSVRMRATWINPAGEFLIRPTDF